MSHLFGGTHLGGAWGLIRPRVGLSLGTLECQSVPIDHVALGSCLSRGTLESQLML